MEQTILNELRNLRSSFDSRFDKIDSRLDKNDSRFDKIDSRLDKNDGRFDKIDSRFEIMVNEMHEIRLSLEDLNKKVDHGFDALLSLQRTNQKVELLEHTSLNHERRLSIVEGVLSTKNR